MLRETKAQYLKTKYAKKKQLASWWVFRYKLKKKKQTKKNKRKKTCVKKQRVLEKLKIISFIVSFQVTFKAN